MKHRILTLLFVISLILLALSPERAGLAQEVGTAVDLVEGERAVITPVIGYQGRLVEGGTPVTGDRVMTFRLYTSVDGTIASWEETKTIYVSNGLFDTALGDTVPFTNKTVFTYDSWLETTVNGVILPRQQLMGAPYAITLAPQTMILDNSNTRTLSIINEGIGIGVESSGGIGVHGAGTSTDGIGVFGSSSTGHGVKATSWDGVGLFQSALYAEADDPGGIALWAHNDSSTSTDAALVVSNDGSGALFKGFGGDSGEHEFMVKNNGDVEQVLSADGLVKAGVYFYCGNSSSQIYRSFNNINASTISISNGTETGRCTLNLGFDLSNRYWVVMNGQNSFNNYSSKCFLDVSYGNIMYCHSWTSAGSNINNPIMLLIY